MATEAQPSDELSLEQREQLAREGGGLFVASSVGRSSKSFWEVLGLPVGADDASIRAAKRACIRNASDSLERAEVLSAAKVLLDPNRRRLYELLGSDREAAKEEFLDADEIAPNLWLGGLGFCQGPGLSKLGVTHLLSVAHFDNLSLRTQEIDHRVMHVNDKVEQDLLLNGHIQGGVGFISNALENGGVVFVHCLAGVSRSATLAVAYLMSSRGLSLAEAFAQVKTVRPKVDPNIGFVRQLVAFSRLNKASHTDLSQTIMEISTWDDHTIENEIGSGWHVSASEASRNQRELRGLT
jgi:protein-tyrosine phosphatase